MLLMPEWYLDFQAKVIRLLPKPGELTYEQARAFIANPFMLEEVLAVSLGYKIEQASFADTVSCYRDNDCGNTTEFPELYVDFQAMVLQCLPGPGEMDYDLAHDYTASDVELKKGLLGLLKTPVLPALDVPFELEIDYEQADSRILTIPEQCEFYCVERHVVDNQIPVLPTEKILQKVKLVSLGETYYQKGAVAAAKERGLGLLTGLAMPDFLRQFPVPDKNFGIVYFGRTNWIDARNNCPEYAALMNHGDHWKPILASIGWCQPKDRWAVVEL